MEGIKSKGRKTKTDTESTKKTKHTINISGGLQTSQAPRRRNTRPPPTSS
jgi:hypothetical protein